MARAISRSARADADVAERADRIVRGGSPTKRSRGTRGTIRRATALLAAALAAGPLAAAGREPAPAGAWPGDPDGAFGRCGLASFDVVPGDGSEAADVVADPEGRYVVAGFAGTRGLVARFSAGGAPDLSFGTGGRKTVGLGSGTSFLALARRPDGRIVAAGSRTSGGSVDSLLVRLTAAGRLDTTFADAGILVRSYGGTDRLAAVQVQPNGAVVVGGSVGDDGFVARVGAGGEPDATFDGDGERTGLPLTVKAMLLQPDGKIVVGGRSPDDDFALMRLNPDGSTDASFGGAGGVTDDAGGTDAVTAIARDTDGNIVATGPGHGPGDRSHTIVRRYLPDGTEDADFDATDRAFGLDDEPVAVLARADGKVVVVANSKVGSDTDVVLLRLQSNGSRDAGFGIGGITLHDAGARPAARDAVLRSDGRAVVAGSLRAAGRPRLALLRYQSDTATAARPAQGFVLDGTGGLHGTSAGCSSKPAAAGGNRRWPTKDTARGVALLPGGRGLVVDRTGAIHPFRFGDGSVAGLEVSGNQRWPGKDLARGIAVVPEGTGGYVVNRSGGLHAFRIGSATRPPIPAGLVKWPGHDRARGIALLPNGQGGYVLDAAGGLHPFGGAPKARAGAPSWPGQDRARGVAIAPDGSGGWVIDSLGRLYAFGIGTNPKPPAMKGGPVWPGPIARGFAALP